MKEIGINSGIEDISTSTVNFGSINSSNLGNCSVSEIKPGEDSINIISISFEKIISDILQKDIKEYINNNTNYTFQSIGPIKHNNDKYNNIYKIRIIEKNGNNFILFIIFNYLENLVLNKNIDGINELIRKINELEIKDLNLNNDIVNEENKKTIIDILNEIISYLTQKNVDIAYNLFIKAFIFLKEFNIFLNYFTRKLIYDYIYKNINNNLSPEEPKKIFDLLPEQYKQDKNGNYILINFKKDIMNMNFEKAHKEIYSKVIPYIFHMDLNIIVFNQNNSSIKKIIKYKYKENDCLNLIYFEKQDYFNIFYSKDIYQKFMPFLNIVNPLCQKCNNIMEQNNKFKLCDNCLIKIIEEDNNINNIYLDYLNFILNYTIKKYTKSHKEIIIKQFSNFSCEINKQKVKLNELINKQGLNIDIYKLFSKIKQKICLICRGNVNNNNNMIKLPCECKFCSEKCFDVYMQEIDKKNECVNDNNLRVVFPMSECFCGYQYKLEDFNNLKTELEKFNNKKHLEIIDNAIECNFVSRCLLCDKLFNSVDKFINLKLKEEKDHLICKKCCLTNKIDLNNYNDYYNKEIFCFFCNKNHKIKSWNEFKGFPECIII